MIKRGSIYWVRLDPVVGSKIGKSRPAVVVSNDINNEYAETVTVVPITSKVDKVYPFEVLIKKGVGGLKEDSKAKANQIRTISKARLLDLIGVLPQDFLGALENTIKIHLDLK